MKHAGTTLVLFGEEDLLQPAAGGSLMEPLLSTPLRPQRVGRFEPLRDRIPEDVDAGGVGASWPFLWKAAHGTGSYTIKPLGGLARVCVRADASVAPALMRDVAVRWAAAVRPAYAAVTVLTAGEVESAHRNRLVYLHGAKKQPVFDMNWVMHLSRGIPDIYWINVFGPRYVSLIGRDRLRAAPAHSVEEVAEDVFVVGLCDIERIDSEDSRLRREALKDYLGRHLFL